MNGALVRESRWQAHARAPWRGFVLVLLGIPVMLAGLWFIIVVSLVTSVIGIVLFPSATKNLRGRLDRYRDRLGRWAGIHIERPYLPEPEPEPGFAGTGK